MNYQTILITGGAGFIGSHLVKHFVTKYPDVTIINLDKLTYAGNLENLRDIEDKKNYIFIQGDITDSQLVSEIFQTYFIDGVIHCAAESHVDRSIDDPLTFVNTNLVGTAVLLHQARKYWSKSTGPKRFHHVSTDEVFGSLPPEGFFTEETPYDPRSPYSASKAGSDHLVRAFGHTYGLPVVISNCSNNYGPFQFPEKLIPLFIKNIVEKKPLPVYGKGVNVRDWLHVHDHVAALDLLFHQGKNGETYTIGGHNEWKNIDLIQLLCDLMDTKLGREKGSSRTLISYVTDRAGHDLRYAIDATKIKNDLGWLPAYSFEVGLSQTIDWYLANQSWITNIKTGAYREYNTRHAAMS